MAALNSLQLVNYLSITTAFKDAINRICKNIPYKLPNWLSMPN